MAAGSVTIVGVGPGAPDLLTLRGRDRIAQAEVIVVCRDLIDTGMLDHARSDVAVIDTSGMAHAAIVDLLVEQAATGRHVVRLVPGDPAVFSAVGDLVGRLTTAGIPCEIVPGVGSLSAAAATLGRELTRPGPGQSLVLTRRDTRTHYRRLAAWVRQGTCLAIYLGGDDLPGLVGDLLAAGCPPCTPIAVVHRATWPNERRLVATLGDIRDRIGESIPGHQTLVLVGAALSPHRCLAELSPPGWIGGPKPVPRPDRR